MSEEQMHILQMVADGKINAEEANQLLEAIARADAKVQEQEEIDEAFTWRESPEMPELPRMPRAPRQPRPPRPPRPPRSPRRGSGQSSRLKSYGSAMRSAGLAFSDRELRVMQHHVTVEYAKAMQAMGIGDLSGEDLAQMAIHNVRPRFVKEARELGLDFTPKELVELHIHGVTSRFIKKAQEHGFTGLSSKDLVNMGIHHVNFATVAAVKGLGLKPSSKEIVDMAIHHVNIEMVQALAQLKLADLGVKDIVAMAIHGIEAELLDALATEKLPDLTAKAIINMGIHGVDEDLVAYARKRYGAELTANGLIDLAIHGDWDDDGLYLDDDDAESYDPQAEIDALKDAGE